jgi:hypothetical protein
VLGDGIGANDGETIELEITDADVPQPSQGLPKPSNLLRRSYTSFLSPFTGCAFSPPSAGSHRQAMIALMCRLQVLHFKFFNGYLIYL